MKTKTTQVLFIGGGKVAYFGRAQSLVKRISSQGFTCPPFYNPAEYFLDLIQDQESLKKLAAVETARIEVRRKSEVSSSGNEEGGVNSGPGSSSTIDTAKLVKGSIAASTAASTAVPSSSDASGVVIDEVRVDVGGAEKGGSILPDAKEFSAGEEEGQKENVDINEKHQNADAQPESPVESPGYALPNQRSLSKTTTVDSLFDTGEEWEKMKYYTYDEKGTVKFSS